MAMMMLSLRLSHVELAGIRLDDRIRPFSCADIKIHILLSVHVLHILNNWAEYSVILILYCILICWVDYTGTRPELTTLNQR